MSDVSDAGALQAPDDAALFNELTAPAPAEPSPPEPPTPLEPSPPVPPAPQQPAPKPGAAAPAPPEPEPLVPTARLREEADARRAAEKRAEALQSQIEALMQRLPTPPAPQAPKRSDLLENPSGFVQEEVTPLVTPIQQQIATMREFYSQRDAIREFGAETVQAAFNAVENGLRNRDPEVAATYNRIMRTMDPYGEMVRWHNQRQTFAAVGGDITAYNKKILEQAMADPEFQARVIEAARKGAAANGAVVAQPAGGAPPRAPNGQFAPAPSPAPSLPSISRVGAAALAPNPDESSDNVSDDQLFTETTRRKR